MRSNTILIERFNFALRIIRLSRKLQQQREFVISNQLMRAGTSIGAQVEEAQAGQSRRDFIAKMAIASKEARETRYWLRLLEKSEIVDLDVSVELRDVEELIRILTAIVKTASRPQ